METREMAEALVKEYTLEVTAKVYLSFESLEDATMASLDDHYIHAGFAEAVKDGFSETPSIVFIKETA